MTSIKLIGQLSAIQIISHKALMKEQILILTGIEYKLDYKELFDF